MNLWYTEQHSPDVRFSIRVEEQLYTGESEFQKIEVLRTTELGKVLTLDGLVMLTEKDEFILYEMITHVAMVHEPQH